MKPLWFIGLVLAIPGFSSETKHRERITCALRTGSLAYSEDVLKFVQSVGVEAETLDGWRFLAENWHAIRELAFLDDDWGALATLPEEVPRGLISPGAGGQVLNLLEHFELARTKPNTDENLPSAAQLSGRYFLSRALADSQNPATFARLDRDPEIVVTAQGNRRISAFSAYGAEDQRQWVLAVQHLIPPPVPSRLPLSAVEKKSQ